MTRSLKRLMAVATVAIALLVAAFTVPVARAQEQEQDPAQEVLAVVSPLANPVCSAAGASTLLVPILGGLVSDNLDLGEVDVAALILDSLGPVFVTCGSLPAPDGTRCEILDDQLVAVWPQEIADVGLTAPPLGGNLFDAINRLGDLLGLDLGGPLAEPLRCSIPGAGEAPSTPPPPPPPVTVAPVTPQTTVPVSSAPLPVATPVISPSTSAPSLSEVAVPATPQPVPESRTATVVDLVARSVPSGVVALQLIVAAALAAFLGVSWSRSLVESRRR